MVLLQVYRRFPSTGCPFDAGRLRAGCVRL